MKKINILQIMIFITITLCSCESCKKEYLTELPPETQTGANTFGCYVNGELFVKDGTHTFTEPPLNAEFIKGQNILTISSFSKKGYINLWVMDVKVNIPTSLYEGYFLPEAEWGRECFCFGGKNFGEIVITKFDTTNNIVSGRFLFTGQCSDPLLNVTGDSIVNITDGRFDIKLNVYE
jgi:hypothetical protein